MNNKIRYRYLFVGGVGVVMVSMLVEITQINNDL